MKYAVIKITGNQYIVEEGKKFLVSKIDPDDFKYLLLFMNIDGEITIGKPTIDKKIDIKIISDHVKGQKIDVFKYKSKSRYRKKIGFRPMFSEIVVEKL